LSDFDTALPRSDLARNKHKITMQRSVYLLLIFQISAAAFPPLQLPWALNRSRFPSYWFGQNGAAFDTEDYLRTTVSKHALAIYGWGHALSAAPSHQSEGQKLSSQCASLKALSSGTRCAVYRQGWLAMDNYDEQRPVLRQNLTATKSWWIQDESGMPVPHSGAGVNMLFYDFSSPGAQKFYQESVIRPLTEDANVDAVFFDDMPGVCCNSEHSIPSHYTREQALAMCDGTLANFQQVADILVKGGKLPIFSMFQKPWSACLYSQQEILRKLGNQTGFARFAQTITSKKNKFGTNCSQTVEMALSEVGDGLSYIQWEDIRDTAHANTSASAQNLSEAVFLLVRGAGAHDYSFYGESVGWAENAWAWHPSYDRLAAVGEPVSTARSLGGGKWVREYEHATVHVQCALPGANSSSLPSSGIVKFKASTSTANCSAESFEPLASHCDGDLKPLNVSAEECMKACCALGAGKCNTWVWCPIDVCGKQTTHNGGGCWLGNRDVCTKSDQWRGGQRGIMPTPPPSPHPPTPPSPRPPHPPSPGRDSCRPSRITDTNDAGCGRWLPRFHPKNALPLAHNNDANAPFEHAGIFHLFMQANFPGIAGWNGAIGLGHLASRDLARWKVGLPPALLPGKWKGPPGAVGQPAGEPLGGYYSGSATVVDGVPRIIIPAVFSEDASCNGACTHDQDSGNPWLCMLNETAVRRCAMLYTTSSPANMSDIWLANWTAPITIADGRADGVQPHGPGWDDTTHAWQDEEDLAAARRQNRPTGEVPWRFAGQTTVCKTPACKTRAAGDRAEYLQLFESKAGSDWTKGFRALGNLFPGLPQNGILNVPDFWKREQTGFGLDFVHFGNNQYWLGAYNRTGAGFNNTAFVPSTPMQTFGHGANEGHGFYSASRQQFLWWGWVSLRPPHEAGVPAWDSCLSLSRVVEVDHGLAPTGDFHSFLRFTPVPELATLRGKLLYQTPEPTQQLPEQQATAGTGPWAGNLTWLPSAAGNCLDIEVNVSWPADGAVPVDFGSVGIKVLGDQSDPSGGGLDVFIQGGTLPYDSALNLQPGWQKLAPPHSNRTRPTALSLRVLVDRSVVEAYAQNGTATLAQATYLTTNQTALIWRPGAGQAAAKAKPVFSVRVWAMQTGHVE
jgi:sucrose-6-phosphate hydrolase SacC (GH32 family)